MAKLFFSYSHVDEELRDELENHLAALMRKGYIDAWHDRRIPAGQHIDKEIDAHLKEADIILFLISSDFIASDYCYDVEVQYASERHKKGEATIIPVILRPCDWKDLSFGKLKAVPTDGRPITKFANRDEAFLEVVSEIKLIVKDLEDGLDGDEISEIDIKRNIDDRVTQVCEPRSSNLRVRRTFTERDRDQFLAKGYEYIANYFENSLAELEKRNSEINVDFRRVDANTFTATVYVNGEKVSRCNIWLAGSSSLFAHGICYGYGDYNRNSYNEILNIEDDGYALYFKPQGAILYRDGSKEKLSFEGAAEFYWREFISHAQ